MGFQVLLTWHFFSGNLTTPHPPRNANIVGLYIYTIIPLKFVGVRKLQIAILARSSREMSLTVRIVWQYILSRVRPSIFFIFEKHSKPRGNRAASASVYFNGQQPAIVTSGAGRHGWLAQTHQIAIRQRRCGGCLCTHSHVHPFLRACVMRLQYTIIIFDPGW